MKEQVYPSPQEELMNAIAWTINTVLTVDQCNDVLSDLRSLGYEIRPAQEPEGCKTCGGTRRVWHHVNDMEMEYSSQWMIQADWL